MVNKVMENDQWLSKPNIEAFALERKFQGYDSDKIMHVLETSWSGHYDPVEADEVVRWVFSSEQAALEARWYELNPQRRPTQP